MQEIGNNQTAPTSRIVMRISGSSMAFATIDDVVKNNVVYEPYTVKSGVSIAANLREAFGTNELLMKGYRRTQLLLDTQSLIIPIEEFDESTMEELYHHSFMMTNGYQILHSVMPDLNSVAVYPINKDLKTVIDDHFADVRISPLMQSVWTYLYKRSFIGVRKKIYVYFHDGKLDVFSFSRNRFKFVNCFNTNRPSDAIYFILYVWKALNHDFEQDELHITGDIPEYDKTIEMLRKYIHNVYTINMAADFNRAPITQIKGINLDVVTYYMARK